MDKKRLVLILLIPIIFLSACQWEEIESDDPHGIEVINLQITPELTHWLVNVADCAEPISNFGVVTDLRLQSNLNLAETDLVLRLGKRQEKDPYVAVMGIEEMVIITGEGVPVSSLSLMSLRSIFLEKINLWESVPEVAGLEIEGNQPIQTLSYPADHVLRRLFQENYLESQTITGNPLEFWTSENLENLLQDHPYAIGYVLKSQLPTGAKPLTIADFDPELQQLFVLAITSSKPGGKLEQLLLCLQNAPSNP